MGATDSASCTITGVIHALSRHDLQVPKYREGDWFAVPLRDGGYAVGLVARANQKGVLLGYFFGPRRDEMPSLTDTQTLTPSQAILIGKFGHLGLKGGDWPILGRQPGWDREAWPMPVLIRYEELTGRTFQVFYDPDDPLKLLRQEQVPPGAAEQGPKDSMMGAGFVEIRLTRLLSD